MGLKKTKSKSKRFLLISLLIMALLLSGCSENEGDDEKSFLDGLFKNVKEDYNPPEFSDEYYLGLSYGGSSWGDYYDCISVSIIICTDQNILVFAPPADDYRSGKSEEIASVKMDEENYNNIVKAVDRQKLYSLKIKSQKDVCDGYSRYLTLYDKDNNVLKACGAYMPSNKEFNEMCDVVYENLPSDKLDRIRKEYIKKVKENDGVNY